MSVFHYNRSAARRACVAVLLSSLFAASLPQAFAQQRSSAKPDVEHSVVAHDPALFHGWPANEGMWLWGDEILVGYNTGDYLHREGKHSLDPDVPLRLTFSRSLDGGKTWTRQSEHSALGFSKPSRTPPPNPTAHDLSDPSFALKMRYNNFHTSTDRGRTWQGPFRFAFDDVQTLTARTSYIVTGENSALVFITSQPEQLNIRQGNCFVAQTLDGGKTFEFLSWIGDNYVPDDAEGKPVHSIMPNAVQLSDGTLLCALRQRIDRKKWTDVFQSTDAGKSWQHLSQVERGSSNPVSLVELPDGRIAAIYGWRNKPLGLRAKLSSDGGKTWSSDIVLRDDGASWDIGYVQAKARPDGTVVIVYYYTTEALPEQHIAATLWKP